MRISLLFKIIFFFSVFTLVLASFIVVYFYVEMGEILEEQISRDLVPVAEFGEGQIVLIFEKYKVRTVDWSSDNFIRSEFEEIVKTNDSQKAEQLAEYIKAKKQIVDPSVMITDIFNLDGTATVSTIKERIGHSESPEELNKEYRFGQAKSAVFGEAFTSSLIYEEEAGHFGKPMWHASAPIVSLKTNEVIGVITNHISGDEFYRISSGKFWMEHGAKTSQSFFFSQGTSEMYLVNKEGLMITPSRFVEDAVLKQKVDTEPIKKCFEENQEFVGSYKNYLNYEVVGASMCLVDHEMVLLAEAGKNDLFAEFKKEINHVILIVVLAWPTSVFLIYLFVRFFLNNLLIIRKAALELAKNNFDVKAEVKSKDEIGDLAEVFNNTVNNIKTFQERIKKAEIELKSVNLGLEDKIKERTKELNELKNSLEKTVAERTGELQIKLAELEKFKKLTIGRELKMIELKKEIEELKKHA